MAKKLEGRVAMITGSGGGIGSATARLMAELGASIAIQDIDEAKANAIRDELRSFGAQAEAYVGDVGDISFAKAAVAKAESTYGKIDILINNAGIGAERRPLEEVTEAIFERAFRIHVGGTLFMTQAVIPGMKSRRYGKIVNVSSINGTVGAANAAVYNGAKGAVLAMGKGWAKEFAPFNICVNIIAPGHCMTDMPRSHDSEEVLAQKAKTIPFGRYATPEEMGSAITFLCSPESDFTTGQVLSPNGGFVIS